MPSLFDLLSDGSDKKELSDIQKKASYLKKNSLKRQSSKKTIEPKNRSFKIYPPDFVALDLETTGLDNRKDRVTEFGAVRFIRGKAVEDISILINPQMPIPEFITELTGISDATVKDALPFKSETQRILKFIGELPICGHQIDFDFNFLNNELKRANLNPIENRQLDTASLSRLLLNGIGGYSLVHVSRHLGVKLTNAHRALDDARASGEVAIKLVPMLNNISPEIRGVMGRFSPYSLLKGILLGSSKGVDPKNLMLKCGYKGRLNHELVKAGFPDKPEFINPDEIENFFKADGKISEVMEKFTTRQSQSEMAGEFARSLNDNTILVAEAGTGTGKSMAYLLPAAIWAQENKSRVVVSTHTRNLQDQLLDRDLPTVAKLVDKNLTYAVLKGRSNYLCLNRWRRFVKGEFGNLSPRDRLGTLPLIKWAEETNSGDVEEQDSFNRRWHARVWGMVNADHHGCRGRSCPDFEKCFLQGARQNAMGSHIVVINHALFFSEVMSGTTFLGIDGPLIFDEAHHLQESGYQHLRVEIDSNTLRTYIELIDAFKKPLEKFLLNRDEKEGAVDLKKYKKLLTKLRKYNSILTSELVNWAAENSEDQNSGDNFIIGINNDPFAKISPLAGLFIVLGELNGFLNDFIRSLEDDDEKIESETSLCLKKTSQLRADLDYLTQASTEDHVFWIEGGTRKKWFKFCGVPLDVGGLLADIWKENSGTLLFTSATMTVSEKFSYFFKGIGLDIQPEDKVISRIFETPFNANQTIRCALNGKLDPGDAGYAKYVADTVAKLMSDFKKNILVLFTSDSMLKDVHGFLNKSKNLSNDITLLAQNITGNRTAVLDTFRKSRSAILLGSGSFWEGVDIPGNGCEIVVIPRLPFTVPSHPLTKAIAKRIEENDGNSFYNFSVPEAVIRFRQGAGRLIRRDSDRGALVIFDRRVTTKNYGGRFIKSLSGPIVKCVDGSELTNRLKLFFDKYEKSV